MLAAASLPVRRGQDEATRIRESIDGKGCSAQTFAIFPKIIDVDEYVRSTPDHKLREGHPEVSFAVMNSTRRSPTPSSGPKGGPNVWHCSLARSASSANTSSRAARSAPLRTT